MAAERRFQGRTDRGLEWTRSWVERWYGDSSDIKIEQRTIACPGPSGFKRSRLRRLATMCKSNESFLHTYMKFCAWNMLHEIAKGGVVAVECLMYTPLVDYKLVQTVEDDETIIDIDEPQVLFNNPSLFPLSYGKSYRVDVISPNRVVEVGQTWPFNLLTPLLDGLADEAIWVPYPVGVEPRSFELSTAGLGHVGAYAMTLARTAR